MLLLWRLGMKHLKSVEEAYEKYEKLDLERFNKYVREHPGTLHRRGFDAIIQQWRDHASKGA